MSSLTFLFITFNSLALTQSINFLPPASNQVQEGFVRLQNSNSVAVAVSILGIDDLGNTGASSITLEIPAGASVHFNSSDVENGNTSKGLTGAFGNGSGNWRLLVSTNLEIKVSAYIRTTEGFLTQVDAITNELYGTIHTAPIFNPASNTDQVSKLRVVNSSNASNNFTISGKDDNGNSGSGTVTFTLAAYNSIEITAQDLENGNTEKGLTGAIGDGKGKWSLNINSSYPAIVMNFLEAPGGYLSNLSTIIDSKPSYESLTCNDLNGAKIYSAEEPTVYLGFFGSESALGSVNNSFDSFGSEFGVNSIRNEFSTYGSEFNLLSHSNPNTTTPPYIVKQGITLARLSKNNVLSGTLSLDTIDASCQFTATSASKTFAEPE